MLSSLVGSEMCIRDRLHIPWDLVDDWAALGAYAKDLGVRLGTINSNTFQDDDYKLGSLTNADPAIRHVGGIVATNADLAIKAVKLRAFGQEIIRKLGERRVHPIFGVPGGVTQPLKPEDLEWMLAELNGHIATAQVGIAFFKGWMEEQAQVMTEFATFPSAYMGLVQADGALVVGRQRGSIHRLAREILGRPANGWMLWYYWDESTQSKCKIDEIRKKYREDIEES